MITAFVVDSGLMVFHSSAASPFFITLRNFLPSIKFFLFFFFAFGENEKKREDRMWWWWIFSCGTLREFFLVCGVSEGLGRVLKWRHEFGGKCWNPLEAFRLGFFYGFFSCTFCIWLEKFHEKNLIWQKWFPKCSSNLLNRFYYIYCLKIVYYNYWLKFQFFLSRT